jgi:hypothetical protein
MAPCIHHEETGIGLREQLSAFVHQTLAVHSFTLTALCKPSFCSIPLQVRSSTPALVVGLLDHVENHLDPCMMEDSMIAFEFTHSFGAFGAQYSLSGEKTLQRQKLVSSGSY